MPASKHRRKPGSKSVRHPGRSPRKAPAIPPLPPEMRAWRQFPDRYTAPFFAATEGYTVAHDVLDLIAERAWQDNTPAGGQQG
jgi:hypothetical protein